MSKTDASAPTVIVLMGVSGSGKTTVGRQLAQRLGYGFADADDYHPPENVEKMALGIPLEEADREPWLGALRRAIDGWITDGTGNVLACSALTQWARDQLAVSRPGVALVYLKGSPALIRGRIMKREGHYMPASLLDSQFATLQEPRDALVVDIGTDVASIVDRILAGLAIAAR